MTVNKLEVFNQAVITKEHGSIDVGEKACFDVKLSPIQRVETMIFEITDVKFGMFWANADIQDCATIDFYDLLAEAGKRQANVIRRTLYLKGQKENTYAGKPKRDATFTFEFSGIPTLSLE